MLPITLNLNNSLQSESGEASTILKTFAGVGETIANDFIAKAGYSTLERDGKTLAVFYYNHAKPSLISKGRITLSKAEEISEIVGGDIWTVSDLENMALVRNHIMQEGDMFRNIALKRVYRVIQNADRIFCIYSLADREFFTEYQK